MKKNITIIVLAICLAVLLIFLFSDGCNKPVPDRTAEKHFIDSADQVLRDSLESYLQLNSMATKELALQDSIITDLRKVVKQKDTEVRSGKSTALQLRNELREYRLMDTGTAYRKIDNLLAETDNLAYLLDQYMAAYDALSDAVGKRDSAKDMLLSQRAQLIAQLTTQYNKVYAGYNSVFNENKDLRRSLKQEKVKMKIAAVLALAGGVIALLK